MKVESCQTFILTPINNYINKSPNNTLFFIAINYFGEKDYCCPSNIIQLAKGAYWPNNTNVYRSIRIVKVGKEYFLDLYVNSMSNTGNDLYMRLINMSYNTLPEKVSMLVPTDEEHTVILEKTIEYATA